MFFKLLILVSVFNFYNVNDTIPPDFIRLPAANLYGKILGYNHKENSIVFYNYTTKDTDLVPLQNIMSMFYNSLPKSKYDTIYLSFKNYRVGKILYYNQQDDILLFWNKQLHQIQQYNNVKFFWSESSKLNKNPLYNPWIYLSIAIFSLIMSISLILYKDYINAALFASLSALLIWIFHWLKSQIWKK